MNKIEIKDMNVFIELSGINTFLIGPALSGKTFLLKKLINKVNNSDIYIDNVSIKEFNIDELKNSIAVVFNDNEFKCLTVYDEINYYVNKLGIDINVESIIEYFKINSIIEEEIDYLRIKEKNYIKIISLLIIKPTLLGIDSLIEYLDRSQIELIYNFAKKNGISILSVISNLEYLDYNSNIIILNKGTSIFCGSTLSVLKGNSILPYMGYKLPFINDLSQNLMLYGLLDSTLYDTKKVVKEIWK